MKTFNDFKNGFSLIILLTLLAVSGAAQSGRKNESQPVSKEAAPQPTVESPKTNTEKPNVAADVYKFIYPRKTKGKHMFYYIGDGIDKAYYQAVSDSLQVNIEEMNRAGAEGYRLLLANRNSFFTLMKLDEGQYQYQALEITNNFTRWKIGFSEEHDRLAQRGFRFNTQYPLYQGGVFDPQIASQEENDLTNAFFYEKVTGRKPLPRQTVIAATYNSKQSPDAELTAKLNQQLTAGFYPVAILSQFEILLEEAADKNELLDGQPEFLILTGKRAGDKLLKRVKSLLKQGYRLWMGKDGIALLYRYKTAAASPVSYVWLEPIKQKKYQKELEKLSALGAKFRTVYITGNLEYENMLVFEVPKVADGKKREYKALEFAFVRTYNEAENSSGMEFTPESQETLKTFHQLIKEGFKPRELFHSGKVSVLLERETEFEPKSK